MSDQSAVAAHPHPLVAQLSALHHFRIYADIGIVVVILTLTNLIAHFTTPWASIATVPAAAIGLLILVRARGLGWAEQAPFDRIMVTAASPHEPTELLKQLKPNGVLVAPVGRTSVQMLNRYVGQGDGSFRRESLTEVRFVPLVEGTAKEG